MKHLGWQVTGPDYIENDWHHMLPIQITIRMHVTSCQPASLCKDEDHKYLILEIGVISLPTSVLHLSFSLTLLLLLFPIFYSVYPYLSSDYFFLCSYLISSCSYSFISALSFIIPLLNGFSFFLIFSFLLKFEVYLFVMLTPFISHPTNNFVSLSSCTPPVSFLSSLSPSFSFCPFSSYSLNFYFFPSLILILSSLFLLTYLNVCVILSLFVSLSTFSPYM